MFKKILVPVDGSEKGYKALDTACEFAERFEEVEINILSVFYHHSFTESALSMTGIPSLENEDLKEVLGKYAKEVVLEGEKRALQKGIDEVQIKGFTQEGHTSKEILDFAVRNDMELIVIGKHEEEGFLAYLFGGTSLEVAELSTCPVLLV